MPAAVPFPLRYTLTRRQRLLPHVRLWGVTTVLVVTAFEVFFIWLSFCNIPETGWLRAVGFCALFAGGLFLLFRGMFNGLIDVLRVPRRHVDIIVNDESAAIVMGDGQRWHLFLDGIIAITQFHPGIWSVEHHNGAVLHIPASAITDDQLAHLRAAMERGRTPEGIQRVIERGRRIQQVSRLNALARHSK